LKTQAKLGPSAKRKKPKPNDYIKKHPAAGANGDFSNYADFNDREAKRLNPLSSIDENSESPAKTDDSQNAHLPELDPGVGTTDFLLPV